MSDIRKVWPKERGKVGPLDEKAERLWSKVDKNGPNGCWMWTACANPNGYGTIAVPPGSTRLAHRIIYERLVDPVPDGLELDHLCRNTLCVNPAHLEPVTHAENIRRSPTAPPALNAAASHCSHGHRLLGDNLSVRDDGSRICVTCQRRRGREAYARRVGRPVRSQRLWLEEPKDA